MKRSLLSLTLIVSAFFSFAQDPVPLPVNVNFNDGELVDGWETSVNFNAFPLEPYTVNNASNVCTPDPFGLVLPQGAINNQNKVVFLSPSLSAIGSNSQVVFRFSFYAFSSPNTFTCAQQTPCTATVKVYLVSSEYEGTAIPTAAEADMVYGVSESVEINTTNFDTRAVINTSVTAELDGFVNFKLMFDVEEVGECGNPIRYLIDNVFIDAQEEIVTPVSFKAFTASRKGGSVDLSWTTASEQNNQGFNIQRNTGGEWQNVAFIASSANGGNSSTDLSYSFADNNGAKGISQYRIQQVDYDGKFSFSDIRSVRGSGAARLTAFPNPSPNGKLNLMFEDDNVVRDVFVNDGQGRLIKQFKEISNNILVIDQLTKGFYTIRVVNRMTGTSDVEKIVVN